MNEEIAILFLWHFLLISWGCSYTFFKIRSMSKRIVELETRTYTAMDKIHELNHETLIIAKHIQFLTLLQTQDKGEIKTSEVKQ